MTRRILAPILTFVAVSAFASPLLSVSQEASRIDPDVFRLTVLSTAIGAAVVWLIWRRKLPYPPTVRTGIGRPVAAAVVLSLLLAAALSAAAIAQGSPWRAADLASLSTPLHLFLLIQLAGALAEEVGWRGLVQPVLETRMHPRFAALVTGLLFAVGHFYMAFAVSPLACLFFVISAVGVSVILAAFTVGRSPGGRIVIATALHFLINMTTFLLFADGDGSDRYFANLAAVTGGLGLVALILLRRPSCPERP